MLLTPEPEVKGSNPRPLYSVHEQRHIYSPKKVLVIPRKQWLCPDMTEKLLTGTNKTKQNKLFQETNNQENRLEDEEWFHGVLPREEVQRLLANDGDFLVRESKNKRTNETQFVLSAYWQGYRHFIIQFHEVRFLAILVNRSPEKAGL